MTTFHADELQNAISGMPATRRQSLASLTALAGGIAAVAASAGSATAQTHDHHDHAGHGAANPHQELIDAALTCVNRGNVCLNHCIGRLSSGDTSLKDCARTVSSMLPLCEALAKLGAIDAPLLKVFAKVCIYACDDCEKECRKHAQHHAECKACAESCAECIKACKTLTDA